MSKLRVAMISVAFAASLLAQSFDASAQDLLDVEELASMSLSELMSVQITIASKRPESASQSAAATFVITQDDIRRSGATTIPEILRLAPGVNVARIDASEWAVSIRGFSAVYADKLLVLVDGRSVYTPLFGGVFWNEVDTALEDIDRIEIVRGPGAALWGINATNGVINIITKSADETRGVLLSGGGGNEERAFATARYGGKDGRVAYRGYVKAFEMDDQRLTSGAPAHDGWQSARGGFRTDTEIDEDDTLTIQGDAFYGESGWDLVRPSLDSLVEMPDVTRYYAGGNLLGRWSRELSATSDLSVQLYYDLIDRNDFVLDQHRDTLDAEATFAFQPWRSHQMIAGGGYRWHSDEYDGTFSVSLEPEERTLEIANAFLQDDIELSRWLRLIAGARLEHNELSDFDFLPNIRAIASIDGSQSVWASISAAARSPARFNHDGRLVLSAFRDDDAGTGIVTLNGSRGFEAEDLIAYETGYRLLVSDMASFDLALFYNDYTNLESAEPAGEPFASKGALEIPFEVQNRLDGRGAGGEVALDVRPLQALRLVAAYSYLDLDLSRDAGSSDTIFSAQARQTPRNQLLLRSHLTLGDGLEADAVWRYVGTVATFGVDDYSELDLRLSYGLTESLDVELIGKNLLSPDHLEFASNLVDTERTELERAVLGRVTFRN